MILAIFYNLITRKKLSKISLPDFFHQKIFYCLRIPICLILEYEMSYNLKKGKVGIEKGTAVFRTASCWIDFFAVRR